MRKKGNNNKKPRPWTTAEEDRLRMLFPIRHNTVLAKLFRRSANAIKKKARKLGLEKDYEDDYHSPHCRSYTWTEEEVKAAVEVWTNDGKIGSCYDTLTNRHLSIE